MKDYTVRLTVIDRMILESYKSMLDGLAHYLGDGYELVLHSLENMEHSAIKVVNGYHTGRKEGAPITDLALAMLGEIQEDREKEYVSYYTKNKNGEQLKSATLAIRGEGSKIIGLLCINFYLNTSFADILSNFIPTEAKTISKSENFVSNVDELIESSVAAVREEVEENHQIRQSLKNKEIVLRLYNQGIFELKDSVVKTAIHMGISKNTVYMHLRNIQES
jgi:predicted transcriptional regulator YheO